MGGALHPFNQSPVRAQSLLKIMISVSGIANVPLYCDNNIDINVDKYVIKAILEQSKGNNEETQSQTQIHNL